VKHAIIPDIQAKLNEGENPYVRFRFLNRLGQYIAEKRPDKIVCLGDFGDVPSLCSYDKGKRSFEGRRYRRDIDAVKWAMDALMSPIHASARSGDWTPELHLNMGNHEHRADRATELQPELAGVISSDDFANIYRDHGFTVYPFLQVAAIDGVMYSHYFTSGVMGRPVTTAAALLTKKHLSCVAGHQQGKQIAYATRADGSTITGMIVGSCYEHEEDFLGPQGNKHWRGMVMLHGVENGCFDEMFVSLDYLNRRFKA